MGIERNASERGLSRGRGVYRWKVFPSKVVLCGCFLREAMSYREVVVCIERPSRGISQDTWPRRDRGPVQNQRTDAIPWLVASEI